VLTGGKRQIFWQSSDYSLNLNANDYKLNFDNRNLNANDNYAGGVLLLGQCPHKNHRQR